MTTICWDGNVLASDRQCTYMNTPMPDTKIWKIKYKGKKALLGAAGQVKDLMPAVKWIKRGCKGKLKVNEDAEFSIILITHSGSVKYMISGHPFYKIGKYPWAIGSGSDYALGAMYAGLSAEEAVQIAAQLDVNTGLGVDTLTL